METKLAHIELLDDVQHLQRGETLCVGGHGIDVEPSVPGDQRLVPFGMVLAKIFLREPAPNALEVGIDGFRDWAVVKCVAAAFGDHAICASKIGIGANVVFIRSLAAGAIGLYGVGCLLHPGPLAEKYGHIPLDVPAYNLRHGRARFTIMNGGFKELGPLEIAVALVHCPPAIERAGR